ncbi:MAG: hypothetical protein NTW67_03810 [Candidatus Woesearchaeota archaeon]|nr:hypothetical protein [Candidatus Woesearchaeota archaeon]
MTYTPISVIRDTGAATHVGQKIEEALQGTGYPEYNRISELAQFLEWARDGFTSHLTSKPGSKHNEEARTLVARCMNRVGWQREDIPGQFNQLAYIIMLTEILKGHGRAEIPLANTHPQLKADYSKLAEFYKTLGNAITEQTPE